MKKQFLTLYFNKDELSDKDIQTYIKYFKEVLKSNSNDIPILVSQVRNGVSNVRLEVIEYDLDKAKFKDLDGNEIIPLIIKEEN